MLLIMISTDTNLHLSAEMDRIDARIYLTPTLSFLLRQITSCRCEPGH